MTALNATPLRTLSSLLLLTTLAACGGDPEVAAGAGDGSDTGFSLDAPRPAATVADERVRYHEVRDPKTGMVQARSPIPESWQVHSPEAAVYISDDKGLKVHKAEQFQFGWSSDQFARQSIQMSGTTVAPPVPLQQIVEQQVRPSAASQGYTYLGSFDVPGVEGFWQRLFAAMLQTGSQRTVDALGTEWESQTGTRSMIILVQSQTRQQQMISWVLQTTEVEAPADRYEAVKAAYLYAVANTEINPNWMAAQNQALASSIRQTTQYWENASEVSRRAHEQRMASIRARGNAALQAGKTYSDILDISHQGYLNRSSINSAGHSAQVDSIHGTTLIGNHETGEHYNIDGNNNHYWVNTDGVYIGTDNSLFDPRLDPVTRDEQWTRFHKER